MTKYKLNNAARSATEVTLTSYVPGNTDISNTGKRDERHYPIPELDTNQNDSLSPQNRNLENRACQVCPHSCQLLQQSGELAASLAKRECARFGLNELRVEGLTEVCLCEKYNGGCKLCPRPSLAPTLSLSLDGKEACLACHGNACTAPYTGECPTG